MSAQEAAVICHLHLWGPTNWLTGKSPDEDEVNKRVY